MAHSNLGLILSHFSFIKITIQFNMTDDKLLQKLSHNLLEILNDEEYYDVTIEVGNDPYVKIFHDHIWSF